MRVYGFKKDEQGFTAVMGEEGYLYDAILLHYYQGAEIKKLYQYYSSFTARH